MARHALQVILAFAGKQLVERGVIHWAPTPASTVRVGDLVVRAGAAPPLKHTPQHSIIIV